METASQPPCPVGLAGPVWTSRYPGGTDAGRVRQGPIVAGSAEGGCRNPDDHGQPAAPADRVAASGLHQAVAGGHARGA